MGKQRIHHSHATHNAITACDAYGFTQLDWAQLCLTAADRAGAPAYMQRTLRALLEGVLNDSE